MIKQVIYVSTANIMRILTSEGLKVNVTIFPTRGQSNTGFKNNCLLVYNDSKKVRELPNQT